MTDYYDKQGNPITMAQWSSLFSDSEYQQVAQTKGLNRLVSTVWLGLDPRHSRNGPSLIFETMVFPIGPYGVTDWVDIDSERYSTLEEAKAGHEEMAKNHAYVLDKIVRELNRSDEALDHSD